MPPNRTNNTPAASAAGRIATTQTVAVALATMDQLIHRGMDMPGFGVLYGEPGLGKTTALARLSHPAESNAVYVSCRIFETPRSLSELLLRENGIQPKARWNIPDMHDALCEAFATHGRPMLVDEADYIAETRSIELLRNLHDTVGVPILLVGEQSLKRKLQRHHERLHDRVLVWSQAVPCDGGDLDALAKVHAPGLQMDADARASLLRATGGVARRIVTGLHKLAEACRTRGIQSVDLAVVKEVL